MKNKHRNPSLHETYINVIPLTDGGFLIDDVTYAFHADNCLSWWDVKYYNTEMGKYIKIAGKSHVYYVYGVGKEVAKQVAIAYHKKRGNLPMWNFDD